MDPLGARAILVGWPLSRKTENDKAMGNNILRQPEQPPKAVDSGLNGIDSAPNGAQTRAMRRQEQILGRRSAVKGVVARRKLQSRVCADENRYGSTPHHLGIGSKGRNPVRIRGRPTQRNATVGRCARGRLMAASSTWWIKSSGTGRSWYRRILRLVRIASRTSKSVLLL